jgi:16S rRNA (cytidine1402-2'-O)-methyltransferase
MPGINDPGEALVRLALERGHRVSPIPGPTAVLTALVASGLPSNSFYYLGFLPREPQARRRALREVAHEPETLVAFETPHRLRRALQDMQEILGADRPICVARELTKVFEEFQRGSIARLREHFDRSEPRGEFTLVIGGYAQEKPKRAAPKGWDEKRVRREFRRLMAQGTPRTEAVKHISRLSGLNRKSVYEMTLKGNRED